MSIRQVSEVDTVNVGSVITFFVFFVYDIQTFSKIPWGCDKLCVFI